MIGGAKEQTWTESGILFVVGEGGLPMAMVNSSWIRGTALRGWMQGTMRCQVEFPQWESHCVCRVQGPSPVGRRRGGGPVGLSWSLGKWTACDLQSAFPFPFAFPLQPRQPAARLRVASVCLHHDFSTSFEMTFCPFGPFWFCC